MTTTITNAEFAKKMMLLAQPAEQFRPTATYDPDGDCIEFLAQPDAFYAERVDELVTVYYSQETGEVIGAYLKGVSEFCDDMREKMPGFSVEIQIGPVSLKHIFLARVWSAANQPDDTATLTYRKLIDVSRETKIEGELCVC